MDTSEVSRDVCERSRRLMSDIERIVAMRETLQERLDDAQTQISECERALDEFLADLQWKQLLRQ